MGGSEQEVRDRIVVAAIECIQRQGLAGVTTRSIAAEAGVNVASINYYFGSKDKLMEVALRQTLREAFPESLRELDEGLEATDDLRAALRGVLQNLLQGAVRYRRIVQAHFEAPLQREDYEVPAVQQLNGFLRELTDRLQAAQPQRRREELELTLIEIWSVLFFSGLLPGMFRGFSGLDLHEAGVQERLVEHWLDQLFPKT